MLRGDGCRQGRATRFDYDKGFQKAITEPCDGVDDGRAYGPTSVTRESNQNHPDVSCPPVYASLPKSLSSVSSTRASNRDKVRTCWSSAPGWISLTANTFVAGGAKGRYNRIVAALVGEKAHILFLSDISFADKDDFFARESVRRITHRRMSSRVSPGYASSRSVSDAPSLSLRSNSSTGIRVPRITALPSITRGLTSLDR